MKLLLPRRRFAMIVADPPWRFKVWSRATGLQKSADRHYPTMTLEDVKQVPVIDVAETDCLLWLWCTAPMLRQGFEVLDAWGFKYSTMGAWHKRTKNGKTQFGTGFRLRSACEPFLIGTRGKPRTTRSVRNLVEAKVREHSRKPDEAYAAAVQLMPQATRLELFSREQREGWLCWGEEAGKFDQPAAGVQGNRINGEGARTHRSSPPCSSPEKRTARSTRDRQPLPSSPSVSPSSRAARLPPAPGR